MRLEHDRERRNGEKGRHKAESDSTAEGERFERQRPADQRPIGRQSGQHVRAGMARQHIDEGGERGGDHQRDGQRLRVTARGQPRQQNVQGRQRNEPSVDRVVRRQGHGHGRERPEEPGTRREGGSSGLVP